MTNRKLTKLLGGATGLTMCAAVMMTTGCGGEPEPVVQAPQTKKAPPPAPPKPAVTPIDQLMTRLGIDERVVLPEAQAPDNDPDRIALLEFFDGIARGDESAVRPMLSLLDQQELDALIENGDWESSTASIDRIELMTGSSPFGEDAVLARIETNFTFQPQLWYYGGDEMEGYQFDAAPSPPDIINKLYGANWIDAWHALLEQEMELANRPDEDLPEIRTSIAANEERGGNAGSGGSLDPGGNGGAGGLREPGSNPISVPGGSGDDDIAGGGAGG